MQKHAAASPTPPPPWLFADATNAPLQMYTCGVAVAVMHICNSARSLCCGCVCVGTECVCAERICKERDDEFFKFSPAKTGECAREKERAHINKLLVQSSLSLSHLNKNETLIKIFHLCLFCARASVNSWVESWCAFFYLFPPRRECLCCAFLQSAPAFTRVCVCAQRVRPAPDKLME